MIVYEADWICPAAAPPIRNGAVRVANGRIVSAGLQQPLAPGDSRIRYAGCAIIPGFVNAHSHLELTVLRGYLENLSLADWIPHLVRTFNQSLTSDVMKVSAQLGAIEMLRAGVTCVGEVMNAGASWDVLREFGMQGIAYQEVFGPAESAAGESLKGLKARVDRYRTHETAALRVGVSPHAPYTVSRTLFELTRDYARQESLRMTVHIGESREETVFVRDGRGIFAERLWSRGIEAVPRFCSPLAYLDSLGLCGPDVLAIHVSEAEDRDLSRLQETRTAIVHCPKSNAKLGNRTARAAEMRELGVLVALGTDSVASNNVVDMFEEMRAAVFHQRALTGRVESLSAAEAFQMATLDGARCLGLDEHLGSIEPGKRADFVVVDLSGPATQPVYDPVETMVYSASRANVKATFLGGREVSLNDSEALKEVSAIAERLRTAW